MDDRMKALKSDDVARIFNALLIMNEFNLGVDENMFEDFRLEMNRRKVRTFDERIGLIIDRFGEITHTNLLRRCSSYANAGDIVEAIHSLVNNGRVEVKEYTGQKGKVGKTYVWVRKDKPIPLLSEGMPIQRNDTISNVEIVKHEGGDK
jgi:hypothetical protein